MGFILNNSNKEYKKGLIKRKHKKYEHQLKRQKQQTKQTSYIYNKFKNLLYKHDGKIHFIEIGGVEPANNKDSLIVDEEYTLKLNQFIDEMRKDGYTVVKVNTTTRPVMNSHITTLTNGWTRYNSEIQYK